MTPKVPIYRNSQILKYWCFVMVCNSTYKLKASVFDVLEMRLKNQLS